ncbi:hypothetical protein BS47DRAFT_1386999 [Hydnum rufescens UP504]|uniref:Uncharacterized protein n=1 Tax=Hydnum rufescens UP504 TaxID=1448309 RepID=A0A9P6BCH7_9AGAM|nr:hypothetical protein BS47DRAFT_1386999 [Hydnum rufescens UP504]
MSPLDARRATDPRHQRLFQAVAPRRTRPTRISKKCSFSAEQPNPWYYGIQNVAVSQQPPCAAMAQNGAKIFIYVYASIPSPRYTIPSLLLRRRPVLHDFVTRSVRPKPTLGLRGKWPSPPFNIIYVKFPVSHRSTVGIVPQFVTLFAPDGPPLDSPKAAFPEYPIPLLAHGFRTLVLPHSPRSLL